MSDTPLVSVVMNFFNGEKFIREAIESVLAQTYEHWELLLVDDGSTDQTTQIAKEYAGRYPEKVRCFEHERHENKGMSASRNLGIARARGEHIAFLDVDDLWLPPKLEAQVAIMERDPEVGLVANPAMYWYADGAKKPQPMTLPPGRLPVGAWIPKILESDNNVACPSAVLMRRSLAVKLGGFEESFRGRDQTVEDQVMWFKISLNSPIHFDPEIYLLYRIHPAMFSKTIPISQKLLARVRLYAWLAEFLEHHDNHSAKAKLLALMAQCSLCRTLLQSISLPQGEAQSRPVNDTLHRLSRSAALARDYRRPLGPVLSTFLVAGAVFNRPVSVLVGGILALSQRAWNGR